VREIQSKAMTNVVKDIFIEASSSSSCIILAMVADVRSGYIALRLRLVYLREIARPAFGIRHSTMFVGGRKADFAT
jgi:hypothetical protein